MSTSRRTTSRRTQSSYDSVMKYTSIIMVVLYAGVGLYILLSSQEQLALPDQAKKIVGGMLIAYSLLRFVRMYNRYFKKNRRDEEV